MRRVRGLSLTWQSCAFIIIPGRKYRAGLSDRYWFAGAGNPVMETRVGQKIPNPTWTPTAAFVSVRWSVALNYRQSFLPAK